MMAAMPLTGAAVAGHLCDLNRFPDCRGRYRQGRHMTACRNCGSIQEPSGRLLFSRRVHMVPVLCVHGPVFEDARGDEESQGTRDCLMRRAAQDRERWGGRGAH